MKLDWLERIGPTLAIAGRGHNRPDWQQPLRVIYDHELMLFGPGGSFRFVLDGVTIDCPENSFLIVPPGVWHSGSRVGGGMSTQCWIHFDWVWQEASPDAPVMTFAPAKPQIKSFRMPPDFIPPGLRYGPFPPGDPIYERHQLICEHFNHGTARERLNARAEFQSLLVDLLVPVWQPLVSHSSKEAHLQTIRTVLHDLANEPFTRASSVRSKLAELGQSYDNQARMFKAAFGITPLHYVNLVRVERAKRLLKETTLSATDIAAQLGFRDPVYFGKLFRQFTGLTPLAFRNQ